MRSYSYGQTDRVVKVDGPFKQRVIHVTENYAHEFYIWLVVWLPFLKFSHILGIIIPIDVHIFQRGSNHQPDIYWFRGQYILMLCIQKRSPTVLVALNQVAYSKSISCQVAYNKSSISCQDWLFHLHFPSCVGGQRTQTTNLLLSRRSFAQHGSSAKQSLEIACGRCPSGLPQNGRCVQNLCWLMTAILGRDLMFDHHTYGALHHETYWRYHWLNMIKWWFFWVVRGRWPTLTFLRGLS